MTHRPERVVLDAEARQDLAQAVRWYRSKAGPEVASRFLEIVRQGIANIAEAPLRWPQVDPPYRRYVLNRFPYKLIFEIEDHAVVIAAIAHAKRRPEYWKDRR